MSFEHQNGLVRYYVVNITETNTGSQFQLTSNNLYITLNNLHPYYTYSVSVAAYTISPGPFSSPLLLTTSEDGETILYNDLIMLCTFVVPSSSPTNIGTLSVSSFQVVLQWSLPPLTERNGIIIGYNISIEDTLASGSTIILSTPFSNITIYSLEPFTTYQYRIAAYTSVGLGPYSDQMFFRTLESGILTSLFYHYNNFFYDSTFSASRVASSNRYY